jgi:DNA ligase 1
MHSFFAPRAKAQTKPAEASISTTSEEPAEGVAATTIHAGQKRVIQDDDDEAVMTTSAPAAKVEKTSEYESKENFANGGAVPLKAGGAIPSDLNDFVSWKVGDRIPYSAVCNTFEMISQVSGRLDKEACFTRLFRAVALTYPSDLSAVVYLASNSISPAYEGLELGIGDSLLVKAIVEATGRKKEAVEEAYKKDGDLGIVALQSRQSQKTLSFAAKPKPLLATEMLENLISITQTKVKLDMLTSFLVTYVRFVIFNILLRT